MLCRLFALERRGWLFSHRWSFGCWLFVPAHHERQFDQQWKSLPFLRFCRWRLETLFDFPMCGWSQSCGRMSLEWCRFYRPELLKAQTKQRLGIEGGSIVSRSDSTNQTTKTSIPK
jgi:hypothetical protein